MWTEHHDRRTRPRAGVLIAPNLYTTTTTTTNNTSQHPEVRTPHHIIIIVPHARRHTRHSTTPAPFVHRPLHEHQRSRGKQPNINDALRCVCFLFRWSPSLPPSLHTSPHTSHLTPHAASVMSDPPPHDTYATSVPSCIGWVRAEAKRAAFVWRFIGCLSRWESFGGGGGGCCCWWWRGVVWARKPLVAG